MDELKETKIESHIRRSREIKNLAKALSIFQGKLEAVKRESENPFFKSKYAELGSLIEATKKSLSENGLSYVQFPFTVENKTGLTTLLMHESGEWLEGDYSMTPKDNTAQSAGSVITYMRRYALGAVLGIATEEDDDGNAATTPTSAGAIKTSLSVTGKICETCGKPALISPRSGKEYCPDWKLHKEKGEYSNIVDANQKAKVDEFFADAGEPVINVDSPTPKGLKKTKIIE